MAQERGSVRFHRGGWEIRVRHGGRRVTRRVAAPDTRAGRREAEAALEALLTELAIGAESLTVAELLDLYALTMRSSWSPSTIESYESHEKPVRAAYGPVEVSKLTRTTIAETNARWLQDVSPSTVKRRHSLLSAALNYAADELGLIAASPARGMKIPKGQRRIPDLPLLEDVLAAVDTIGHDRLRVVARLAVATGARRGELVALRWSDVDLDRASVTITRAVSGSHDRKAVKGTKSGTVKHLALDPDTIAVLRDWRKALQSEALANGGTRPGPGTPVVPSPSDLGGHWEPRDVTHRWVAWRKNIDALAGLRFHDLRHLHATSLLAAGVPVTTVAERLGHSTSRTMDLYGHAVPAHDQRAADVIAKASKAT